MRKRCPKTQPSSSPRDFSTGWDLIVPKGWGVSFWKTFVFSGARPIGGNLKFIGTQINNG